MAGRINILNFQFLMQKNRILNFKRNYAAASQQSSIKSSTVGGKTKSLQSLEKSLSSKGFLRSHKAYEAPPNAAEKVNTICKSLSISTAGNSKLEHLEKKFELLDACFRDFQHTVPNSQLHELQTVEDVIKFYETSVDTTVPYDALKNMELPENLHIQYDYLRFHPDTDTKFNGLTAFPKSSTLVTGLKYRGKYKGYVAKRSWP